MQRVKDKQTYFGGRKVETVTKEKHYSSIWVFQQICMQATQLQKKQVPG